jgi:hypothetical protein
MAGEHAATDELWRRIARPFVLSEALDALIGLPADEAGLLAAMRLCESPEVAGLMHDMPVLLRSLSTSVSRQAVRSRGEIRGPVLWSETISARAASFGDPDLFVCTTPQRDYDTPENRALVQALAAIAAAGQAIDRILGTDHDLDRIRAARQVARTARHLLDHPALAGVPRDRLSGRAVRRAKGGKSGARYRAALTVLERAADPVRADDVTSSRDRRTGRQHEMLVAVIHELERRGLHLPEMRVEEGALLGGPITYLHPRRGGRGLHGILVGDVLLDVPEHPDAIDRGGEQRRLEQRSGGRRAMVVFDPAEVPAVVDAAVRSARERVARAV